MYKYISASILAILFLSCSEKTKILPIMGERTLVEKTVDGKKIIDTAFHKIGNFNFKNQVGKDIT
jgi:protein SCO1/2